MGRDLWRSIRPHQWTKNLFVLAPLVFAQRLDLGEARLRGALAFVSFCLLASAVYLFNDLLDLPYDRTHPEKQRRPIASGRLPVRVAALAACGLGLGAFAVALGLGPAFSRFALFLAGYAAINVAYTLVLKHAVVVDALTVAAGFLLRIHAGGVATQVEVSHWLSLCTLFVAFFLALSKRRAELALLGHDSTGHRRALGEYSGPFLDQLIALLGACTILSYALYTVSPETIEKFGTDRLWWSVPFVIYGVARYLYLVGRREGGGNPTRTMLRDLPFLANAALWGAVVLFVIYGRP